MPIHPKAVIRLIVVIGLLAPWLAKTPAAKAQTLAGEPQDCCCAPYMKNHLVPTERAEAIIRELETVFKRQKVAIWNIKNGQIMVWASPNDQDEIAKQIKKLNRKGG